MKSKLKEKLKIELKIDDNGDICSYSYPDFINFDIELDIVNEFTKVDNMIQKYIIPVNSINNNISVSEIFSSYKEELEFNEESGKILINDVNVKKN